MRNAYGLQVQLLPASLFKKEGEPMKNIDYANDRIRILLFSRHMLIGLFNEYANLPAKIIRLKHEALPEDAEVVSMYFDYSRNAFGAIIRHESFDAVPDGETIPFIPLPTAEIEAIDFPR